MSQIVVVGSCSMDFSFHTSKLPNPGQTIQGKQFHMDFGGKGANQCIAAQKLGADTGFVGCIGSDTFGSDIMSNFNRLGVYTGHIVKKPGETGVAQITVTDNGENHIIIVAGANGLLQEEDVERASPLLYLAKVILLQFETPLKTTEYLLKKFSKENSKLCTIVNGAPAPACFDDCQKNILKLADVFCVNESEAEIFTNSVIKIDGITSASQVLSLLLEKCGNIVIITLGPLGVIYASVDKPEPQWVEALCVKNPVDTTGAGDAFLGALAYFFAYNPNLTLYMKIKRACDVATKSVQRRGAQSSFPVRNDFTEEMFI